jgi:hypothetical protein
MASAMDAWCQREETLVVIHVGTSGCQDDSWRGRFYPKDVRTSRWSCPGIQPAFEFRHPSWQDDDVFAALDRAGAGVRFPGLPFGRDNRGHDAPTLKGGANDDEGNPR